MLSFDATQIAPNQGAPSHPVGKFPAFIASTEVKPTKENNGFYLQLNYKTQAGDIPQRFNLWNANPQAVTIANGQLSAVCHATGIYRIQSADASELRNAQLMIEVREQKGNTGYTEVARVYDRNGNEPGKAQGGPSPAPAQQPPPMQQQPQPAGWPAQGQPMTPPQGQVQAWPSPAGPPMQQPQPGMPPASPPGWPQQQPQGQPGMPQGQPQPGPQPGAWPAAPQPQQQWQQNAPGNEAPPWNAPRQ